MKSCIIKKDYIKDVRAFGGYIGYVAFVTPKGFNICTHWGTEYYVYPKSKGKKYLTLFAYSYYKKSGIWK